MSFLCPALHSDGEPLAPARLAQSEAFLSKRLLQLYTLETALQNLRSQADLSDWLRCDVGHYLPHERSVSGIAQIALDSWAD